MEETVIKFKFVQPFGLVLGESDRTFTYTPELKRYSKELPGVLGIAWVEGLDLDKVFEIKLKSEMPRDLPPHIAAKMDPAAAAAFRAAQAEEAAKNHSFANKVRDGLAIHVKRGAIEIVADSFLDAMQAGDVALPETMGPPSPAPKKRGRPRKAV